MDFSWKFPPEHNFVSIKLSIIKEKGFRRKIYSIFRIYIE